MLGTSGVARGIAMGRSAPGGKIEVIPKKILGRGYKRAVDERKIERLQKKVVKKFLGYETKISKGGKFKIRPGWQTP